MEQFGIQVHHQEAITLGMTDKTTTTQLIISMMVRLAGAMHIMIKVIQATGPTTAITTMIELTDATIKMDSSHREETITIRIDQKGTRPATDKAFKREPVTTQGMHSEITSIEVAGRITHNLNKDHTIGIMKMHNTRHDQMTKRGEGK